MVNRALHWLLFAAFAFAVSTGVLLYVRPSPPALGTVELMHRWTAWVILACVVLHVPAHLALGLRGLLDLLQPRAAALGAGAATITAGVVAGITLLAADRAIEADLPEPPLGDMAEPVLDGFWDADEVAYYEDKLAILLSADDPRAALRSIHLGPRPIAGRIGPLGGAGCTTPRTARCSTSGIGRQCAVSPIASWRTATSARRGRCLPKHPSNTRRPVRVKSRAATATPAATTGTIR